MKPKVIRPKVGNRVKLDHWQILNDEKEAPQEPYLGTVIEVIPVKGSYTNYAVKRDYDENLVYVIGANISYIEQSEDNAQ